MVEEFSDEQQMEAWLGVQSPTTIVGLWTPAVATTFEQWQEVNTWFTCSS